MSESKMTPAEVLAVIDSAFGHLGWRELRKARAAIDALVNEATKGGV